MRIYSSQELQMDGFTLGLLQSLANYRENNSLEFGLISGFSSENYRVDLTYTFPSSQTNFNPPPYFKLASLWISTDSPETEEVTTKG